MGHAAPLQVLPDRSSDAVRMLRPKLSQGVMALQGEVQNNADKCMYVRALLSNGCFQDGLKLKLAIHAVLTLWSLSILP